MTTVVAAVIEHEGFILIGQRRPDAPHPLKWEFPGGKVERGETPQQALVRELDEELGIRAALDGEITRYEYVYPNHAPILLIFFRVSEFDRAPRNRVFLQIAWAAREELAHYDFLEGDVEFVRWLSGSAT